jgi:arsenate reductase
VKKVLFVCIGNCCRSQIAEGFARFIGSDLIEAASAGISPTETVSGDTIATMAEAGFDISDQFPKPLDPRVAKNYDIIVNMSGFDLPPLEKPLILEWEVQDPFYEDSTVFREVREDIRERVTGLIEDIRNDKVVSHQIRKPKLWDRLTSWR